MRVLAARFPDRRRAFAVKDLLRRKLDGDPPPEVDIAPLAVPGEDSTTTDTLLAGRFADDQAREVTALVQQGGGEIVVNVDESWTRPRVTPSRPKWGQQLNRGGVRA
jgi:hypothetical protein